jgi:hypothetical protein
MGLRSGDLAGVHVKTCSLLLNALNGMERYRAEIASYHQLQKNHDWLEVRCQGCRDESAIVKDINVAFKEIWGCIAGPGTGHFFECNINVFYDGLCLDPLYSPKPTDPPSL